MRQKLYFLKFFYIERLVKKFVNKITVLKFIGVIFAHGVRWVIFCNYH